MEDLKKALELLEKIRVEHGADGIKLYYISETNYTIKLIKGEKVIRAIRKRNDRKSLLWDCITGRKVI